MRRSTLVLLATAGFFAASCNTIAGAGRDIQAIGHGVTSSSETVQNHDWGSSFRGDQNTQTTPPQTTPYSQQQPPRYQHPQHPY